MTSQERSMLYYFLDSIFGCPADLDTLSKMIQKTAQERKLSDDFVLAVSSVVVLAKDTIKKVGVDIRAFYNGMAKASREADETWLSIPIKEALEAIRRSTLVK